MPPISQPVPPIEDDLAQRAAEVRRLRVRQQAEHGAFELALSVRCSEHEHDVSKGDPCYPLPTSGVCGARIAQSRGLAKVCRARQRKQQQQAGAGR